MIDGDFSVENVTIKDELFLVSVFYGVGMYLFPVGGYNKTITGEELFSFNDEFRKYLSGRYNIPLNSNNQVRQYNITRYFIDEGFLKVIIKVDINKAMGECKDIYFKKKPKPSNDCYIENIQDYIDVILKENENLECNESLFYRGHSKSKYKLVPSVLRDFKDKESDLYRMFIMENASEFNDKSTTLDMLMKMQHYKLPTRLLDLTTNSLVALWFATTTTTTNETIIEQDNDEIDGTVLAFRIGNDNVKFYDSDTVACLTNLAKLTKDQKNKLIYKIKIATFKLLVLYLKKIRIETYDGVKLFEEDGDSLRDIYHNLLGMEVTKEIATEIVSEFNNEVYFLLHFIKNDKPYFLDKINPFDLCCNFVFYAVKNNIRLKAQSGAFVIYGVNECNIDYNINVNKIKIKNRFKKEIRKHLGYLGINEQTIYLDLESSAKYIKSKFNS